MPDISIVIPVYNEEKNIYKLHERLTDIIQKMQLSYEFVFVNDGSRDNSLNLVKGLASTDPHIRFIDFSRNFGHQVAVTAGLDHCKGDAVVIIDSDLQDPPELIAEMYSKMKEGYEVVYAKRKSRAGENFLKKFTAKIFYRLLAKITSVEIPVDTGDFRIMNKKIVEVLKQMPEQQKYLRGQIPWIGFRQTYVEYDRDERHAGETGYTYRKMLRFAMDGITSFSTAPLKFATASGFAVSFISFIWIIYALFARFIIRDYVPGWTSIMIAVLFIGGVQLICIGIIGEYISRMSANIRSRPLYVIRETNVE